MASIQEIVSVLKNAPIKERRWALNEYAEKYFEQKVSTINPNDGKAIAELGFLYVDYNDLDYAKDYFIRAIQLNEKEGYGGLCGLLSKDAFEDKNLKDKYLETLLDYAISIGSTYALIYKADTYVSQIKYNDYKTACAMMIDLYTQAYRQGNYAAAYSLYYMYEYTLQDNITNIDHKISYKYLMPCCKAHYLPALATLMKIYDDGDDKDIKVDHKKAFKIATYIAKIGYPDGFAILGKYYGKGIVVKPDGNKSAYYDLLAGREYNSYYALAGAKVALWGKYMKRPNYELALQCLFTASFANIPDAGLWLAYMAYYGVGCKKDLNYAIENLEKYMDKDVQCKEFLAILTLKGEYHGMDIESAKKILKDGYYSLNVITTLEYRKFEIEGKVVPQDLYAAHHMLFRLYDEYEFNVIPPVHYEYIRYLIHPLPGYHFSKDEIKKARNHLVNKGYYIPQNLQAEIDAAIRHGGSF